MNAQQTEYLEEVYRASQRMVNLINVLLSISRIEMGISIDEAKQVDTVALAEVILKESKLEMETKKLILKKSYSKNIPQIYADPKQVTMIFQNLISNAIKYTSEGGKVSVDIHTKGNDLLINVGDTGMGIPDEAAAKIFTRFFRATNAKEAESEGTGLGLYILKAIIEQIKGKIWFDTKEHAGTTFHVSLPLTTNTKRRKR
jgi:signal transduction histidine kinase